MLKKKLSKLQAERDKFWNLLNCLVTVYGKEREVRISKEQWAIVIPELIMESYIDKKTEELVIKFGDQ